jgi:hypothetical protein
MENALSNARNMDVKMVQAASMLGIVDYTDDHLERKKVALLLTTLRRPSPLTWVEFGLTLAIL